MGGYFGKMPFKSEENIFSVDLTSTRKLGSMMIMLMCGVG